MLWWIKLCVCVWISGRSLQWMLTRDYHLDDRLSVSHVSRRRRQQRSRVGAINDIHSRTARPRINGQLYMTQVTEVASISKKKHFVCPPPPIWRPLNLSPPKWRNPYGTELYHRANFHANRRQILYLSLGQKYIIFLLKEAMGLLSHVCYSLFRKLSSNWF